MTRLLAALVAVVLFASAYPTFASDVAFSPDNRFVLVQKNLGVQRWAIVRDQQDLSVTGNIFNPEGGSQFVSCTSLGNEMYHCLGNSGCTVSFCLWDEIATVRVPESFFQVPADPVPTPFPTPRQTPRPTNKPTPQPQSGLSGLLGTWLFAYSIGPVSFSDTIRLQRLQTSQGVNYIRGLNQFDSPVFGGASSDVFSNPPPFDWAVIARGTIICEAYVFDQSGDAAAGVYYLGYPSSDGGCTGFHGAYIMVGFRTSHTAAASTGMVESVKRAAQRSQRAKALEARVDRKSGLDDPAVAAALEELSRRMPALGGVSP
jgi:hypothetical protein